MEAIGGANDGEDESIDFSSLIGEEEGKERSCRRNRLAVGERSARFWLPGDGM